jgi:putative Holliday junction resolvase
MGRVASIDYGLARLGIAISDERQIIASTLGMVKAEKTAVLSAQAIVKSLSKYQLDAIIVGLPLHMNGKKGFMADEVMHFIALLKELVNCEVLPWDERLSSLQAEKVLREGNMNRKKRAAVIDGMSAAVLLQSYLDAKCIAREAP